MFQLSEHFLGDLFSCLCFGIIAIVLFIFGYKFFDMSTPRCDFEGQARQGNIAAAIVSSSVILSLAYVIGNVIAHVIG